MKLTRRFLAQTFVIAVVATTALAQSKIGGQSGAKPATSGGGGGGSGLDL